LQDEKLEDILRVIELCRSVERSSVNPFDVDIREKIVLLRKHLPEWKFLDELLLDSEAMLELAQIVKLQDEWLKHRASSLYIDPLLIQFKVKLLAKEALVEAFVRSWHPLAQVDQLSPKGLEKAFVYWRDLAPMSERFKAQFGNYGVKPGSIDFADLLQLRIFTQDQFEDRLDKIHEELTDKSEGNWLDYKAFIKMESFEEKVVRAYLLAFLISEGKATLKTDPLTGQIWVASLSKKAAGVPKSVAVSITSDE
jgi:hypothetical protein